MVTSRSKNTGRRRAMKTQGRACRQHKDFSLWGVEKKKDGSTIRSCFLTLSAVGQRETQTKPLAPSRDDEQSINGRYDRIRDQHMKEINSSDDCSGFVMICVAFAVAARASCRTRRARFPTALVCRYPEYTPESESERERDRDREREGERENLCPEN